MARYAHIFQKPANFLKRAIAAELALTKPMLPSFRFTRCMLKKLALQVVQGSILADRGNLFVCSGKVDISVLALSD